MSEHWNQAQVGGSGITNVGRQISASTGSQLLAEEAMST
jgi:hypothetical protein